MGQGLLLSDPLRILRGLIHGCDLGNVGDSIHTVSAFPIELGWMLVLYC